MENEEVLVTELKEGQSSLIDILRLPTRRGKTQPNDTGGTHKPEQVSPPSD